MSNYPPSWFCPNCGHQNQMSFRHCTDCGTALPPDALISQPENGTVKKGFSFKQIVGMVLLGILGIGGLSTMIQSAKNVASEQSKTSSAQAEASRIAALPTATPVQTLTPKQLKEVETAMKQVLIKDRKAAAEEMQRSFLSKGMDVDVRVSGTESKTIKFQYVLWSRPLIYQLVNEQGILEQLRSQGYTNVIFYDGYRYTWNFRYDAKANNWSN